VLNEKISVFVKISCYWSKKCFKHKGMKNKKHPTISEKHKICTAASKGNSISELGSIFDYHKNLISRWIKEWEAGKDFERKRVPGSGSYTNSEGNCTYIINRINTQGKHLNTVSFGVGIAELV
jgi:transposase-like protein